MHALMLACMHSSVCDRLVAAMLPSEQRAPQDSDSVGASTRTDADSNRDGQVGKTDDKRDLMDDVDTRTDKQKQAEKGLSLETRMCVQLRMLGLLGMDAVVDDTDENAEADEVSVSVSVSVRV